MACET